MAPGVAGGRGTGRRPAAAKALPVTPFRVAVARVSGWRRTAAVAAAGKAQLPKIAG